jgi:AraC-like DNA-binding protein
MPGREHATARTTSFSAKRAALKSELTPYRRETPIALVAGILRAYRRYGANPLGALQRADIPAELLQNPAARITARQIEVFTETAMRELDDEGIGMYTQRLPWGSFEMITRACQGSENLEVALRRWCRYRRLMISDLTVELRVQGAVASLVIHENKPLGEVRDLALLSVLRHVHGLSCWLLDSRLPVLEVAFPGAPPPHAASYRFMFPGPVRFGAEQATLRFSAEYLRLSIHRDEQATRELLVNPVSLMIKQYRRDRLLLRQIRTLLNEHLHLPWTASELAAHTKMSTRSLHRQLAQEGSSLVALKDEARRVRAAQLLAQPQLSLKRVADQLGFSSAKSFARAFQRWYGVTPAQWQRQSLAA